MIASPAEEHGQGDEDVPQPFALVLAAASRSGSVHHW